MPPASVLLPPQPVVDLDDWSSRGGGEGLAAARRLGPDSVIDEIDASGLRGRGGAGFPTGRKWRGVRDAGGTHRYVVANAAEGEPATFKDRTILRVNPYQVVEGLAIAALALESSQIYVGVKASFEQERERLVRAITEIEAAGWLEGLSFTVVEGPDEYLFGEEKGLLEVLEGRDPLPRLFPPYVHGLFATAPQMGWDAAGDQPRHPHRHESNPTLVNNVETLANVPHVLAHGADWFRQRGTDESPGTVVCTVVGDVRQAVVEEVDMGTPFSELLAAAGGVAEPRSLKAVLSGVANPVLTADRVDVRCAYEAFEALGGGLGAAGFVVYDDSACMVSVARTISRFLYVESCNQCPACKFGTGEITAYLDLLEAGKAHERTIDHIGARLRTVTDANRCYLPVQEQRVIASLLTEFPEEFAAHLVGGCPSDREIALPKLVDIVDGDPVYDERQARKQPDWTYT